MKGLVCEETMVSCWRESITAKFVIKQVDKRQIDMFNISPESSDVKALKPLGFCQIIGSHTV